MLGAGIILSRSEGEIRMLNGNRLREVRKKRGLTQTELGELIGVGKSAICCYEKETRNPTLEAVIEMIHVFGVSADYLLGSDYLVKTVDKNNFEEYVTLTKEEIVFIEVKTRTNDAFGKPIEAVDNTKQKHLIKAIKYYIYSNRIENQNIRVDVIEVYKVGERHIINHIKQVI